MKNYNLKQITSKVLKTTTLKQSGVTLIGTFLNGAVGVIFYILVARNLGPHDFGVFSFITVTVALVASVANAGTDTGVTKFVASFWQTNKDKSLGYLKLGFFLKITGWALVAIVGYVFSYQIANLVLKKDELIDPLKLSLVGVGGSMLFSFGCAALQSLQRFWHWSFVNVFGNSIRLIIFLACLYLGINAFQSATLLFILMPFIAFASTLFFLPNFFKGTVTKPEVKTLLNFNKWVAITGIIVAISTRLDSMFATRFLTLTEVGYYSVAVSLAGFISQIVMALGTVAAPKFSAFVKVSDAKRYFLKFQAFVILLALIGIPSGILTGSIFVPAFYGEEFIPAIGPLSILIVAYALFLVSMPIHTAILYFLSNSRFFTYIAVVHLVSIILSGLILIPLYGVMGAALTVLVGMIINLVLPAIYLYNNFSKPKKHESR